MEFRKTIWHTFKQNWSTFNFWPLITLWGHFKAPYFKMLNDARVESACFYVRTCQRVRNSKNIATIRDFHLPSSFFCLSTRLLRLIALNHLAILFDEHIFPTYSRDPIQENKSEANTNDKAIVVSILRGYAPGWLLHINVTLRECVTFDNKSRICFWQCFPLIQAVEILLMQGDFLWRWAWEYYRKNK